jgi:serine/threonine protein phosphatase PrpC
MKLHLRTRHRSLLPFLLALCLAVGAGLNVTLPVGAAGSSAAHQSPTLPFASTPPSAKSEFPDQGAAIARITTVLIVTEYDFTYDPKPVGTALPSTGFCTGAGVIVSSPLPKATLAGGAATADNALYILTDASVTGADPNCADLPDVPKGINRTNTFKSTTFFLNNSYSGDDKKAPLSFQITSAPTVTDVPNTTLILVPVPLTAGARTLQDYPAITLATQNSTAAQDLITLTNSNGAPLTNKDLNPTPGTNSPSPNQFLMPQATTFTNTPPANTPPGTPIIDATSGELLSVVEAGGTLATATAAAINLPALIPGSAAVCPANTTANCLATRWATAMAAFYKTPTHRDAQQALQSITTDYADFGGAQPFLTAASPQPTATAQPRTTGTGSPGGLLNSLDTSSKIALLVLIVLVILVIITGGLIYGRRLKRKRMQKPPAAFPQRKSGQVSSSAYAGPGAAAVAQPYAGEASAAPVKRTVVCPYCSAQNNAGSSNCYNCGRELPQGVGGVSGAGRSGLARSTSGGGMRLTLPSNPPPAPAADIAEFPTMVQQPLGAAPQNMETTLPSMPATVARADESTVVMRGRKRPALGVRVSTKSDIGQRWRTRGGKGNEDNFLAVTGAWKHNGQVQPFGLFVIADGMGGHASGQDASKLAVETIYHHLGEQLPALENVPDDQLTTLLQQAVQQANQAIYQHNQRDHADMGCTMTAALITGNEAHVCNVGDSRTYILTAEDHLQRITTDHSIVESLVAAGVIQRDDVYTHPKRNQIYRSLGEHENAEIDTFRQPLTPGDKLLLCCDGLWEMVRDPDIEHVMRMDDLPQVTNKLIDMANEAGGADNITAIVVKITDETRPPKSPMIESVASGPADISPPARR